ncbi:alpha/beta hydrolase [Mycolicibacterium frederiksbergense]|uniref:alpha/beta hydrolase n=1 Tax=Mycolicibacterium frederiksbergense TaxID=117567 RepID=UPI002474809F|nr:alpha/beta hydrolase fold domain-containing protein [Mycolicibacterium frederiksbergense]
MVRAEDLLVDVSAEIVDDARRFYAVRPAGRGPRTVEELIKVRSARAVAAPSDPSASVDIVQADQVQVPVRIFTPANVAPRGVYMDIHGGGFYMDCAARDDVRNHELAAALNIAVVSVDYRLAPEHPWPAAPNDCESVARWLVADAQARFGSSRLVIGGRSAGATLAMTTLLRLRDSGDVDEIDGVALQFGTFDLSAQTPAGRHIADEYFLEAYVGHVADRTVSDISPVYGDLHGLPPILMVVGAKDVLLEDNLAMASRLCAAGNDADIRIYPESPHGFTGHPTAMAQSALDDINSWLLDRFASAPH